MARRVRTIALLMLLLGALALAAVGGIRLDQRFMETRFRPADATRLCPLALFGNQATPMCQALPGW